MIDSKINIAIISSEFNSEISEKLLQGTLLRLKQRKINEKQINIFKVPGAVEIPLIAKLIAQQKKYQAIICLGCVIRGDTDHYQYVCQQVSMGCQHVMLEYSVPVIFGVLTTKNLQQAKARVNMKKLHKGVEVADAAIAMINLIKSL